jgi:hypothetical protein
VRGLFPRKSLFPRKKEENAEKEDDAELQQHAQLHQFVAVFAVEFPTPQHAEDADEENGKDCRHTDDDENVS